jgi:hypothetical protein
LKNGFSLGLTIGQNPVVPIQFQSILVLNKRIGNGNNAGIERNVPEN